MEALRNNVNINCFYLCSEHNDNIVGIVFVSLSDDQKSMHLCQSALVPELQGKGLARHLPRVIERNFPAVERLTADTRLINSKSRAYFEKNGFKQAALHDLNLDLEKYMGFEFDIGQLEKEKN